MIYGAASLDGIKIKRSVALSAGVLCMHTICLPLYM